MRHFLAILFCLNLFAGTVLAAEDQAVAVTASEIAATEADAGSDATAVEATTEPVATDVDTMLGLLNPAQDVQIDTTNMLWGDPVSQIGQQIQVKTWLAVLIFLPFLIIPQVLLLVVIFKFRDRKDGRKPATFVGHHTLEFWWTVIPIIVLIIVTFPMVDLLYEQEMPPKEVHTGDAMEVRITGKQFNWIYDYPDHGVEGVATFRMLFEPEIEGTPSKLDFYLQEPAVFMTGKVTTLFFSAIDVTHAWGVPAIAVKKDCFVDRITHSWFSSDTAGWFEGQCYELCGAWHGKMIVTIAIVEPEQFTCWVELMQHRSAATALAASLRAGDQEKIQEAAKKYFDKDQSQERKDAALYWLKYEYLAKIKWLENHKRFLNSEDNVWVDGAISKTRSFMNGRVQTLQRVMANYRQQANLQSADEEATAAAVATSEGAGE